MQTRTFTLLVTVTDDGIAAVFNPIVLAAAVQGALKSGCRFVLSSTQVEALNADDNPLMNATVGEHRLSPVAAASVDAFNGDATHLMCVNRGQQAPLRAARRVHAELRSS